VIGGRATTVSLDTENQIACTDCHNPKLHDDDRINAHTDTVACQTCHVPEIAVEQATKTQWDWSKAGDANREEDTHHYLKIKGEFIYEKNLRPAYRWSNGLAYRYLLGDPLNADGITALNAPRGDIRDPNAKIWPFKIHYAKQPYDTEYNYLLQPVTSGEGGFWQEFDWDKAFRLGEGVSGLKYSGHYDFAETEMFWPSTHMVATKEKALQCQACHSEDGRMDWLALGYDGDPIKQGSRTRKRMIDVKAGADHE
jgi:Zn finger protein HypA/HybF involved in hydrogenase expression